VGKIEAIENVLSHGLDRKSNRYVPNVSETFRERWIVSPNTISNLGIGEAVVCLAQFSPAIVKFKNVKMKKETETAHFFEKIPKSQVFSAKGGALGLDDSVGVEQEASFDEQGHALFDSHFQET
jgi:hypothetical protein